MAKHRSYPKSKIVGTLGTVMALVAGLLVYVTTSAPAPIAQAADINIGTLQAQVHDQIGTASNFTTPVGDASSNCILYNPVSSATSSTFVTSPNEAQTSHGRGGSNCPSALSTSSQSTVGLRPAVGGNVTIGTPFLLGRVIHYNNPINAAAEYFAGKLDLKVPGFTGAPVIGFDWTLWETSNDSSTCTGVYRGGTNGDGSYNCKDEIKFSSAISSNTLTQDGIDYKVVINGFDPVTNGGTCPTSPSANQTNSFLTNEGAQTHACIFATLTQVRTLTVIKKVDSSAGTPAGNPSFGYTSTSNISGSPWASTFNLVNNGSTNRQLLQGETVNVTETIPSDDRWSLTSIVCKQADGSDLPPGVVSVNTATGKLTLANVPAASAATAAITCTYTNKYSPKNTLTLVKTVTNGSATKADFTLTATGPSATVSGLGNAATIVNQRIPAGSYVLSEVNSGSGSAGYVPNGTWTCLNQANNPLTVTGSTVVIPDSGTTTSVTCTIANRFATGSLQITKKVVAPTGAYTGGTTKTFSGAYNCGVGFTGSFTTLTTAAPFTVTGIPVGRVCSVTETTPTGGLLNASYAWTAPSFSPATVTIGDGATGTIEITNTVVQNTGNFSITKVITGPGGYVGGNRTFPVQYSCTLTGATTLTGTVNISTAGAVSAATPIPTGSVCTFTETLTRQSTDFTGNDPSYVWSGYVVNPTSVTINNSNTDGPVAVTVTNTYTRNFGSLKLTKAVSGSGYTGTGTPFTVNYNCGPGFTGSVQLSSTGSSTINNLPAGATCTLSETAPNENLLDDAHDWGTPTWNPGNQVVITSGATVSATVTNPTVAVFGTVTVTKALSGATGGVVSGKTFAIRVVCTNGFDQTFNVAVGATSSTTNLPVGTSCDITETAPAGGLVDGSYGWGATPATQTVKVTASGQIVPVTVTNPVVRTYGNLKITKVLVDPNNVVTPGRAFTGTWSCVYGTDPAVTGTFSLANGQTFTTTNGQILIGSVCTVNESASTLTAAPKASDASYVWQAAAYAPGASVTVTTAASSPLVTVTNTVTRLTGSFGVNKTVTGSGKTDGYVAGSTFPFTWSCTTPDGPQNGTFNLADGAAFPGPTATLPAGSVCTVTEGANPNPTSGDFSWDSVGFVVTGATGTPGTRSVTFTIPTTGAVSVAVTNTITRKLGSVVVKKVISGATAGLAGTPNFQITLACGTAGTFQLSVPAGGSATQANLPIGTVCAVSEAAPTGGLVDASYTWGTATYSPASVTVNGPPVTATVTNPIERVRASVYLEKTFTGPAGIVPASKDYTGTWSCVKDGTPVTGTWTAKAGAGQVLLADNILVTSTCTATEDALSAPSADGSYRWLAPTITGVTVSVGGANKMTVVNTLTRDTGSIQVTKALSGATGGYQGTGKPFLVRYTCTLAGFPDITGTVNIAPGGTETVAGIPFGWLCSFSEDSPTQSLLKDPSYSWGTPTLVPATVKLTTAASSGTVAVTNPINRVRGAVNVTKIVNDAFGAIKPGTVFTGGYSCVYPGDAPETGTWTTTGAGTFTGRTDLLVGSVCSVTENALSASNLVDGSWQWNTPVLGANATVTAGTPATLTVTNSAKRLYAGLTITKALSGATAGVKPSATFDGTWTCVLGSASWSDRFSVVAGGTFTAFTAADQRVPATAVCSIVEDTPGAADLVDGSYAFGNPVYAPADVTLAAGQSKELKVTNPVVRVYANLLVVKKVTGPGAPLVTPTRVYTGSVSCVYSTDAPVVLPWSATTTAPATVSGILVGSKCTVTEDGATRVSPPAPSDPSYVWLPEIISPVPATVTAPTADVAVVTVTNPTSREFAGFSVKKVVTGATEGITGPGVFPMTYSCLPATGPAVTGSFDVLGGQTWTLPAGVDIPGGSVCTVTEPAAGLPTLKDGAWTWDAPTFQVDGTPGTNGGDRSVQFTLPAGSSTAVAVVVTNNVTRTYGKFTVTKTSSPVTGSTVTPGSTINYTVTVKSIGSVPVHDVVVTDDLTDVLPHAVLNAGSIVAPAGTTTDLQTANKKLIWTVGTVAAGDTLVLTYSATVNADAKGVTVKNVVTATGDTPPEGCDPVTSPCTTEQHTPKWSVAKTSNPGDGATVVPGQNITYTLTVTNNSAKAIAKNVVVTDSLADVLDNATFVGFVGTPSGAAAPVGGLLTWTAGDIAPGGTATLSYIVKVNATAVGVTLRNVVTANGDTPPEQCSPADTTDADCSTTHYTPKWTVAKTSDPATGSTVLPGDVVTYHLTVTNESADAPATGIVVSDDLSDVLDDAGAFAFVGTSAGATRTGNTLTWTVGTLAPGATTTLSYKVTVNADAKGVTLKNVATGTGTTPPQECTVTVPCTTTHSTPSWTVAKSSVPSTGSTVVPGQTITYSLTVTNSSDAPATAVVLKDNLSDLLDDATFGAFVSGYVGSPALVGDQLTWTVGTVPAHTVRVLQYTVTVKADSVGATLKNVVTGTGTTPPNDCTTDKPCSTTHFTPKWTVAKTSVPASGSTVLPGTAVAYTLTVTNESDDAVANNISLTDNLADVLDDATFNGFTGTHVGNASLTGNTLTWTIDSVPVGATRTLTYTVIVKPTAVGANLRNVVTGTGDTPPEKCTPAKPCDTEHFTPEWTVEKSSDPTDGSKVLPGQVITYKVKATNTTAHADAGAVTITDNLANVLNNATLVTSNADLLAQGATLTGNKITWSITDLAAASSQTLTYQVKINDGAFGKTIGNVVTGEGDVPPTKCVPGENNPSPDCSTNHYTPLLPTVTKSLSGAPVQDPTTGVWTVKYSVVVTNPNATDAVPYDLTDDLGYPAGLVVNSAKITGSPAGVTVHDGWNGQSDKEIVTGATIPAASTHTYEITVKTFVPVTVPDPVRDCDPETGAGHGFFNGVTLTAYGQHANGDACGEIPEPVTPTVNKDVVSTVQQADGSWTIKYSVTVTNPSSTLATGYTLKDAFDFGGDIDINGTPTVTGPSGVTVAADWNGQDKTTIVTNQLLPASAVHVYTVTVNADVDADATTQTRDCTVQEGEEGTGFLNKAQVSVGDRDPVTDDACSSPVSPEIDKQFVSAEQNLNGDGDWDGTWTVKYSILVNNPSATTGLIYNVTDTPDFPAGVTVNSASATGVDNAGDPITGLANTWAGGTLTIKNGRSLPAAEEDSYLVSLNVTVAPSVVPGDCETGPAFHNTGTVASGNDEFDDSACGPITEVVVPQVVKTVSSLTQLPNGTWNVVYSVVVTNPSENLAAKYDLSDSPEFGGGIVINSAAVTAAPAGVDASGWNGGTNKTIVTGKSLGAGKSHTYVITINESVTTSSSSSESDCVLTEGENGTGFLNKVVVSVGDLTTTDQACAEPVTPTITKTLVGVDTTSTPGTYKVSYDVTVSNEDAATGLQYSLDDALGFPAGVTVSGQAVTAKATTLTGGALGDVVTPNPAWTGTAPTTALTSAATALPAATRHVYTVTVLATVPADTPTDVLACNPQTPEGHGLFNGATVSFGGTPTESDSESATACGDIPVRVQVDKVWIIDGVTFEEGTQPAGFEATPTLDTVDKAWGTVYDGYTLGSTVVVGEKVTTPNANCVAATGEGLGDLVLSGALTKKTITNVVNCATTLTLVKEVDAVNGGEAVPADWTLQASNSGGVVFDGAGTATHAVVPGVEYTISELAGPAGWRVGTTWSCVNSSEAATDLVATDGSDTAAVTLGYGDDVTCTIVNTDYLVDMAITIDHAETGNNADRDVVTKSGVNAQYDYIIDVTNDLDEPATGVKVVNTVEPYLQVDPNSFRLDGVAVAASGLRAPRLTAAGATVAGDWTITLSDTDANGFGGIITATYAGVYQPGDTAEIAYTVTVGNVPKAADGSYIDIPSEAKVSAAERETTYVNNVDDVLTPVEYIEVVPSTVTSTPPPTTVTSTVPPTTITSTTVTYPPLPPTPPYPPLPNTGVPALTIGLWGMGLLLAGGLALLLGARRRQSGEGSHV